MERSTTYGCHFIDQPLSSFIPRIDPTELPTHARWWIQQASSVGGISPNFGAASSSLPSQAYDLLVGLFLCGRTPCAITGYVNMEFLQGSHSVPNLSFSCLYYSISTFPTFLEKPFRTPEIRCGRGLVTVFFVAVGLAMSSGSS